jgi:hypothetical protein
VTKPGPVEPECESLIFTVAGVIETATNEWTYMVEPSNNESIEHYIMHNGERHFSLRETAGQYYIYHHSSAGSTYNQTNKPNEYPTFGLAIAAAVEGLDWGELPPGDPQIWRYDGYDGINETFAEYLSGQNNHECGNHYFANDPADYSITIESYSNQRPGADPDGTISVLTISNSATRGSGTPVYRERFAGQQQAFNKFLSLLECRLSKSIYTHEGNTGDSFRIPSIEQFMNQS